jgi:flavodoxin
VRALVVYESMYGNTHLVADAIAGGIGWPEVQVVSVREATPALVEAADLLVVGGPTHVHGMSRTSTRTAAVFDALPEGWARGATAAAFDTRMTGAAVYTGRASKGIAKRLEGHRYHLVCEPESFLVQHDNHLVGDELERARAWGEAVAAAAWYGAASTALPA